MWLVLGKTFLFITIMSVKQECLNEIVYLDFQENTLVKSTITMNECLSAFTSTILEEVHLKKNDTRVISLDKCWAKFFTFLRPNLI